MLYFKNAELAETHHVSVRTILNWIEASKQGKLDLTLHEVDGRSYVSNTARNIATIDKLVEDRRKYRNTRSQKTVTPKPEFYKLYNQQQILDIVSNLDIYREIPRQYNYFNGGANYWNRYATRLANEQTPNILNCTQKLLKINQSYIDNLLSDCQRINVIDVGVGNALPVRDFLQHLLDTGKLGRYVAIDISSEMLAIAETNIKKWFGNKVEFEGYEYDVTREGFPNILAGEYIRYGKTNVVNVLLMLGGTFNNLRRPGIGYRMLHDSMSRRDILIHSQKLDSETSRRYFDFNVQPGQTTLSPNHRFIFDLLSIDESMYDVEMGYDEVEKERYIRVRLRVAISIKFKFDIGEQEIELNKDDTILLWRARHQGIEEVVNQFTANEFYPLHLSQTKDQDYVLTISRITHK